MNDLNGILKSIKEAPYSVKINLMTVLANYIKQSRGLPADQRDQLRSFISDELNNILAVLQDSPSKPYREKDEIFCYKDALVHFLFATVGGPANVTAGERETIETLDEIIRKDTVVENAVIKLFGHDVIVKSDVDCLIDVMNNVTDPYQIGILYSGLFHYREKIARFEPDAKAALAEYVAASTDSMLDHDLNDDELLSLEYIADICVYFPSDSIKALLKRIMKTNYNRPRYYALDTLLTMGENVDKDTVRELAQDISVASLTYGKLAAHKRLDLFPTEFTDEKYLAKSDMSQWLLYPTELNKLPDEIECLGEAKIKKDKYFIFKYKTDSENLPDELKNEWLIGWSGDNGGTFSRFDKLADYQKKTPEKTVKYIVKKLIK